MTDEEIYKFEQEDDHDCHPSTCINCPINDTCEWAWDLYNLDGDCLAEK